MKIVLSTIENGDSCNCRSCETLIAKIESNEMDPSAEDCYNNGRVPIPNFGWFCDQDCALQYELKHSRQFARNSDGKIDYYK
jgi:hypothetical protein